MPAFTWHHCLPTHTGGRNIPCSRGRKPLQKKTTKPFPNRQMERLWELPSVVWHLSPLLHSLAFKYYGTPSHGWFLPFSPPGISTFSSLPAAHVPTALRFSFLPLSSGTRAPAAPHGPNPRSWVGQPPHQHPPLHSTGIVWQPRCQGWKCSSFWGSMPLAMAASPTDAATRMDLQAVIH